MDPNALAYGSGGFATKDFFFRDKKSFETL